MGIKEEHKQKQDDYMRLKALVGSDISDYCGSWCNNDVLDDMLKNPTKKNAIFYYSSLITRYFEVGCEDNPANNGASEIDLCDSEIYEILKRNGNV